MNGRYLLLLCFVLVSEFFFTACYQELKLQGEHYEASWNSLKSYEIPEWYKDAKLGIFVHWGPYCVPEYGSEWYPRLMYMDENVIGPTGSIISDKPSLIYEHHVKYWGTPDKFGYKDFIPMFSGEYFNPEDWMDLFQKSGAKYVVSVAEHSDGFAMYNSSYTKWNARNMGPKRDVLKELANAAHSHGLKFGASSHFAFNWHYYVHKEGYDTMDPQFYDLYGAPNKLNEAPSEAFVNHWWDRTKEIIDQYPLDILWFDFYWKTPAFGEYHPKVAAYYYNTGLKGNREVVLQCKNNMKDIFPEGAAVMDIERGKFTNIKKDPWQTDTSIGKNSWGYVKNWESKSADQLIDELVDVVSKNGCLLLNVGPQKDGTIPAGQVDMLLEIGNWLETNGDAIYGTRPWKIFGEGPSTGEKEVVSDVETNYTSEDIRFTSKGDRLYVLLLAWPADKKSIINSLGKNSDYLNKEVASIKLLGCEEKLGWDQLPDKLVINLPNKQPTPFAHVLEVDFE